MSEVDTVGQTSQRDKGRPGQQSVDEPCHVESKITILVHILYIMCLYCYTLMETAKVISLQTKYEYTLLIYGKKKKNMWDISVIS